MRELRRIIRQLFLEAISLDVKPGDVILTGRFKNKRRIVKTIGTDKYGQPTINGKSILKFKIEKKMPKKKWSAKSRAELKEIRQLVRMLLLEEVENPDMVEKLNILIDAANENEATWNLARWDRDNPYAEYPSQEWDQIRELMHSLDYIDNPPRNLKCWYIVEMPDGEILNSSQWLSYDDAIQYAEDNDLIPADRLGNPNPNGPEENGCELYFTYEK